MRARESLRYPQLVRRRPTELIEPAFAVEARRRDHERVAVPAARRVAHPCGLRVRVDRAAVREDLAPERERLVENSEATRRLDELPRIRNVAELGHTLWQAMRVGILARVQAILALVEQAPRPRFVRNLVVAE